MADIPQAPPSTLFQPQVIKAPTQGFEALKGLFSGVEKITNKLDDNQIAADKLIGANQIQSTARGLQAAATQNFPGDYTKQQEFFNKGMAASSENFIPSSHPANRSYFKAVTSNVVTHENVSYSRNIQAQNLKAQKTAVDQIAQTTIGNSAHTARTGNGLFTQDMMGQFTINLRNALKGHIVTPDQFKLYHKQFIFAVSVATAKTQMDAALATGGIPALNKKLGELLSDRTKGFRDDPKQASTYDSDIRSYKNGIGGALKASQEANKQQVRDVLYNTLINGKSDPQKITNLNIEDENSQKFQSYTRAKKIWSEGAIQRQKDIDSLDLSNPNDKDVTTALSSFDTRYNKDRAGFLINQSKDSSVSSAIENADPQGQRQIRSTVVQMQRARGDINVNPMTNAEVQPLIQAAASGGVTDWGNAFHKYLDEAGPYQTLAVSQAGKALVKAGISDNILTVAFLDDKKSNFARNLVNNSRENLTEATAAAAINLSSMGVLGHGGTIETQNAVTRDSNITATQVMLGNGALFNSNGMKFLSSLRGGAGAQAGVVMGAFHENMAIFSIKAVAKKQYNKLEDAQMDYMKNLGDSFNYFLGRDGSYVRIPLRHNLLPLDQNKVRNVLGAVQSNLNMRDVDLSNVKPSLHTSQELAKERYWRGNGALNHWSITPDGEHYVLKDSTNLILDWKKSGTPIMVSIDDMVSTENHPTANIDDLISTEKKMIPNIAFAAHQPRIANTYIPLKELGILARGV